MKNRLESRFAVGLSTFIALAAFACSGASTDTGLGTGSKNEAPTGTAKKADDTAPTTDTSKTSPTPQAPAADSAECAKKATAQDCGDCCIAKNPAAWDAAGEVGYACICAATTCQTACAASICAAADNQNEPTAACKTCLDANDQACQDKSIAACDANADCKAIDACMMTACEPIAQKEGNGAGGTPKVLSVRGATRSLRPR